MRRGIEKATGVAVRAILDQATAIEGRDDMIRVGAISARSVEIGGVIADAIEQAGRDGVVNVVEGNTLAMQLDFVEGMHFDKGSDTPIIFISWGSVMYIQGPPPEVREQIDKEVSKRTGEGPTQ